ncbi:hypothetical protein VNO77_23470 [Canavalia gladiata]|uniref:Uncharacterized protein n=1 Tax=Canavalia gladiata TaxID=3824 RepID=A0AAN9Q8Y9_CANGL
MAGNVKIKVAKGKFGHQDQEEKTDWNWSRESSVSRKKGTEAVTRISSLGGSFLEIQKLSMDPPFMNQFLTNPEGRKSPLMLA